MKNDDFRSILGITIFIIYLAQIEKDRVLEMLDFLQKIPTFSEWSTRQLSYLYYKIETEHFIYKQTTNSTKSKIPYVYIIKDGEFEQIDKVKVTKDIKFKIGDKITVEPANLPWRNNFIRFNVICRKLQTGKDFMIKSRMSHH